MKFLCIESSPKGGGALKTRFDNVEDILGNVEGNLETVLYKGKKNKKKLMQTIDGQKWDMYDKQNFFS